MELSQLPRTFIAFRDQCQWLAACYTTFSALYESGDERKKLLHAAAPAFFHEHNLVLQQHCILQICKLTDPAGQRGKSNLTVARLNNLLGNENLLTGEIEALSKKLAEYRKGINDSRNRLISHLDECTVLLEQPVGAHSKEELTAFLETLYRYTDAVGLAIGVGPLDYKGTAGPGDAYDLIKHLKNSLDNPAN